MTKYAPNVIEAVRATVRAYRELIADPAAHVDAWRKYGGPKTCRLCVVTGAGGLLPETACCPYCPLGPTARGCVEDTPLDRTYTRMHVALRDWFAFPEDDELDAVKTAATERLNALLDKMGSNGLDLNE